MYLIQGKKGGQQANGKSEKQTPVDIKVEEVNKVEDKEPKTKDTKESKKAKKEGEKKRKRDEEKVVEKTEEKLAENKLEKATNGTEKDHKKEKKEKKDKRVKAEPVESPEPDVLPFLIDVAPTPQTQLDANSKKRKASEVETTPKQKKNAKKQVHNP